MEEMKQLVDKLNRWNYEYYTLDNPSVSDKEWNEEYDKLLKLEKETGIVLPNSPSVKVGGEILEGFEKVEHKNKLWSLDKAQSFEELKNWHNKNVIFVKDYNKTHTTKLPQLQYVVTKKFDGLTLKCEYEGIDFKLGSTRGTGSIGEVVTEQCKAVINLPLQLKDNSKQTSFASFHGECLMSKKALAEYNKTAKEPLKNTRNGVAGAIRNLDSKETAKRKPIVYFYNINDIEGVEFQTYEQQLDYMKFRGLPVAEYVICNTYEEIIQAISNIEKERPNLPYEIDGSVIAINDLVTRIAMGFTTKFPRYSLAYKYEAEETTTKLIDVGWNTTRSGRINPVAILEPVELMGSTIQRATLNNIADIERKRVKINATVFLRKSNDVIPEITGTVDDSLSNSNIKDILPPDKCPSCNGVVERINDFIYCTNDDCKAKLIQKISHYASRNCMNIEGFSEATIEKFIELGYLKSIQDIYYLANDKCKYKNEIIKLDGFGKKSFTNLVNAINKSKQCKLEHFIFALGIPQVGKSTAKNLVEFVKGNTSLDKINEILNLQVNDLMRMKDTGKIVANSIYEWFKDTKNREILSYLSQTELTFIDDKPKEIKDGIFSGKNIYCTGKFACGNKEYLRELVESNGGIFANGLNKQLSYLVIGSLKGSGKEQKAKELGVTVLQEDEFLQIIKGN